MTFRIAILIGLAAGAGLFLASSPASAQPGEGPDPSDACETMQQTVTMQSIGDRAGYHKVTGQGLTSATDIVKQSKMATEQGKTLILREGSFAGADFSGASLGTTCFVNTDLENADFSSASGKLAFIGTNLAGANFSQAQMPGVVFHNSDLSQMNASHAKFTGGRFSGGWFDSNLDGWTITRADMSAFVFDCGITLDDGCPVYQGGKAVSARGANFHKADLSRYGLFDADMTAARLDQAIISPRQLPQLADTVFEEGIWLQGGDNRVALSDGEARTIIADAKATAMINDQPSFDCAKAGSTIENLICAEYESELRALDRRMAELYAAAREERLTIRVSQQAWLRQRNSCATLEEMERRECVTDDYQDRIGELVGEFGDDDWLAPGESALFVDDVLPLSDDMRESPLFARIAPILAAASFSEAVVTRNKDGSFQVIGQAVGANAHLCSLSAKHARLDPKNGWYIVPHDETASFAKIFRVIGDELQIIGNGKPEREDEMASVDYVSCGMRAYFPDMRRIGVSADIVDAYRDSLEQSY